MSQNVIFIKRKVSISRTKGKGGSVVRINEEATQILEDFANKVDVSFSLLASNFIKFAAENTIIKEEE